MSKPTLDKKALEAAIEAMDCFASYDTPTTLAEDCVTAYLAALSQAEQAGGAGQEGMDKREQLRQEVLRLFKANKMANDESLANLIADYFAALSPAPAGVQVKAVEVERARHEFYRLIARRPTARNPDADMASWAYAWGDMLLAAAAPRAAGAQAVPVEPFFWISNHDAREIAMPASRYRDGIRAWRQPTNDKGEALFPLFAAPASPVGEER